MIFRFVAEYSQRSDLRREFARDPHTVLDRYDISETERQHLLAGDREQVARQLHAEIEEMFSVSYQAVIWPVYYPNVVGPSKQQAAQRGEATEIAISVLNLAPEIKVRFHQGELRLDATILQIDRSLQTGVHNLRCQAVFPESGSWDLEIVNLVEGEERSDVRTNYFTISGDQSDDLLDAIPAACTVISFREARRTGSPEENRSVHERLSGDRFQRGLRAASEDRTGQGGSPLLFGRPERQAEALASPRAGRAPADRTRAAAAA